MKAPGKPIVKAEPLKGFFRRRAIYLPVDTPSRILGRSLEKRALRKKIDPGGLFFILENSVVLYQALGAPAAVIGLERLIATGVEEILVYGFCGSLKPGLSSFAAVSITKAHSEEGTSGHYVTRKKIFHPSGRLRREVEGDLKSLNLPFTRGVTVSTDSPYRETESWLRDKQKKGIDVVDMEASAVFALGEYYDIPAAALMIVSDELAGKEWKNDFGKPRLSELVGEYFLPFL